MEPEKIKVWITKYALTRGIIETDGSFDTSDVNHTFVMARIPRRNGIGTYTDCCFGNEWHKSRKRACDRAVEMRANKINSLKKQIAKLEAMTF